VDVVAHHSDLLNRGSFLPGNGWKKIVKKPGNTRVDRRFTMSGCPNDMHVETVPNATEISDESRAVRYRFAPARVTLVTVAESRLQPRTGQDAGRQLSANSGYLSNKNPSPLIN
jgi:hypothetical protein